MFSCKSVPILDVLVLVSKVHYAGFLVAPAKGFGLWPRLFLGEKRAYMLFFAYFCCSVVTLLNFSSNHSNFEEKYPKISKMQKKNKKKQLIIIKPKIPEKFKKNPQSPFKTPRKF